MRSDFIDLTGKVFGRLSVARRAPSVHGRTLWECLCECGVSLICQSAHLRSGATLSCGCLRRERMASVQKLCSHGKTHGLTRSREHKSWEQMRARCRNPKHHAWRYYGGKGIAVCARWDESFESFLSDMGPRPSGCELDRIDPTRGYDPSNCRWLDRRINGLRALPSTRHLVEGLA